MADAGDRKTVRATFPLQRGGILADGIPVDNAPLVGTDRREIRVTARNADAAESSQTPAFNIYVDRPAQASVEQQVDPSQISVMARSTPHVSSQRSVDLVNTEHEQRPAEPNKETPKESAKADQTTSEHPATATHPDNSETDKSPATLETVQHRSKPDEESGSRSVEATASHPQRSAEAQPSVSTTERANTSGEHRTAYIEQLRFDSERKLAEAPLRSFRVSVDSQTESVDLSLVTRNRGIQIVARASDPQLTSALQRDLPELSTSLSRSGYEMRIPAEHATAQQSVTSVTQAHSSDLNSGNGSSPQGNKQKGRRNTPDGSPAGKRRGTS
jgi:hypothetical protein